MMRRQQRYYVLLRPLAVCTLVFVRSAFAGEPPAPASVPHAQAQPARAATQPQQPAGKPLEGYCRAMGATVASEQVAREKAELQTLATDVDARVAELEKRIEATREWVARRDAFMSRAQDGLVQIYARMAPEAAANQLAALGEETAAALLLRLEPAKASALMAEMDVAKAARLTALLSAAGELSVTAPTPTPTPSPSIGSERKSASAERKRP